jgi:hypothetical protein
MDYARVPVVGPEQIPDGFRRVVEQIADDVVAALPSLHPRLRIEIGAPGERPLLIFTVWFDFVRRASFGVSTRLLKAGVEQLRGDLAARLQNVFTEEYGRPLPPCPGHQHALAPQVRDVAVWLCPYDPGHWSCRIGDYRVER